MYEIKLTKLAEKQLFKLGIDVRTRIVSTLERIKIRPHAYIKRLVGCSYFSLRVGDYRIILDIKDDRLLILVLELGHRKNIYRKI